MVYKTRGNGLVLQNERFRSDTKEKKTGFRLVVSEVNKNRHMDPCHKRYRFTGYCLRKEKWTKRFQDGFWFTREMHQFTEKSMLSFT